MPMAGEGMGKGKVSSLPGGSGRAGEECSVPVPVLSLAARKAQPLLLQQEPLGLGRGGSGGSRCPGFPFGAPRGTKSHRFPCQREPGGENNKKQKARGGAGWSRADAEDGINQLSGRNIRALRLVVNAFSSFPKTDTMRDQGTFPIVTGDLSTRSSPMWKSLPAGSGISRETVTIAAWLPVHESLRTEVRSVLLHVTPWAKPKHSYEKPSREAPRQQEQVANFTAATERGREGQ